MLFKVSKNPTEIREEVKLITGKEFNFSCVCRQSFAWESVVASVSPNSDHHDIKVISIVKGSNRVRASETIISEDGIIELDKYSKAFLILQEIRNESHRFAIQAQRNKKIKKISQSELDSIKGIGEILKKRLLTKFKSIKNLKCADVKELMTVEGINEKIAKEILDKFKND